MRTKLIFIAKTVFFFVLIFNNLFLFSQKILIEKSDNLIEIEAEKFDKQFFDKVRYWKKISFETDLSEFGEKNESQKASNQSYIQILPDTRRTHNDSLKDGVNFSDSPDKIAVVSYKVKFKKVGRYYVWVKALSTGTEDNGLHVGIDNTWPESGKRMQWCGNRGNWMWGSKQRTKSNHCGEPYMIFLDINKKGKHTIQFSMREDGFRFDKFILTTNKNYLPTND
ncbi:MAG: hypothetical protein KA313_03695 [Pseudarcicella sp.]|nr:hypothetical protein [Pseudarcicella sp.]MBP6410178.1 hypothetical protein [Pseudarcicella sp.]